MCTRLIFAIVLNHMVQSRRWPSAVSDDTVIVQLNSRTATVTSGVPLVELNRCHDTPSLPQSFLSLSPMTRAPFHLVKNGIYGKGKETATIAVPPENCNAVLTLAISDDKRYLSSYGPSGKDGWDRWVGVRGTVYRRGGPR